MPFTISHAAFAAPLKKLAPRYLCATGLVLGSMAPDLEYFVALKPFRTIGHSLEGFMLIHLPLCTALAFAFHTFMRPTLPLMLPSAGGADRFAEPRDSWGLNRLKDWVVFIASLFIGFLTHMFMDEWTHKHTFFYERLSFLRRSVAGDHVYHWLQYGFSVFGIGALVLYAVYRWWRWRSGRGRDDRRPLHSGGAKLGFILLALLAAAAVLLLKAYSIRGFKVVELIAIAPFTAAAIGWFTAGVLVMHKRNLALGLLKLLLVFGSAGWCWASGWLLERHGLELAGRLPGLDYMDLFYMRWIGCIWLISFVLLVASCWRVSWRTADQKTEVIKGSGLGHNKRYES
ncbi:hypothetical protein DNH61_08565 [Paenibacillus sambharensis]|uniref:DUF4184 domain-containing protein n=1 Tax=Paenibacillus sambharensis TaxID=1803190 RepID=A0A2W1LAJ8_9BACL|nr:DUF4184 family protein [Paenibacillus sambharensis]PZD96246.1 hypothetical protein DNH61_08565 [Paenibacillus sambharensis]